jgi:hypothetical protein
MSATLTEKLENSATKEISGRKFVYGITVGTLDTGLLVFSRTKHGKIDYAGMGTGH